MMETLAASNPFEKEAVLKSLRQELKEWENSFSKANNRKAERDDIKQHPAISEKMNYCFVAIFSHVF